MIYTLMLKFNGKRHCLECPLKRCDDTCSVQDPNDQINYSTWEDQLEGCPLVESKVN